MVIVIKIMATKQVKDSWDDSSDEEMECIPNMQVPKVQVPKVQVSNMQDNCKNCYVCNHDIENDTSYYPQCENKALLDRMKEMDECSSDEEENEYDNEEEEEDDYTPDEYDDECDAMDKKMGRHVMCR